MKKYLLYLDDVRIPTQPGWILVTNYDEFVDKVNEIGLANFNLISLDHDLGQSAMTEWFRATHHEKDNVIKYENISEKTGMDCAKFLVELSMDTNTPLPPIVVHSANNVGSENIMELINNYLNFCGLPMTCRRVSIEHTIYNGED